jgi:hypothetical protein
MCITYPTTTCGCAIPRHPNSIPNMSSNLGLWCSLTSESSYSAFLLGPPLSDIGTHPTKPVRQRS